jgi:hypothetical protein
MQKKKEAEAERKAREKEQEQEVELEEEEEDEFADYGDDEGKLYVALIRHLVVLMGF